MSYQPKPFVHAEILAAWATDPEGVTLRVYIQCEDRWACWHTDPVHAPSPDPSERYRATLRDGSVIESPEPEPKWEVRAARFGDRRVAKGFGTEVKTGATIYGRAPDPEGTARMIAAKWNGEEEPDYSDIPEGCEYMPSAVLPKSLTREEIRSYEQVWLAGALGVFPSTSRLAADHPTTFCYATQEEAQQVYDAIRRRER